MRSGKLASYVNVDIDACRSIGKLKTIVGYRSIDVLCPGRLQKDKRDSNTTADKSSDPLRILMSDVHTYTLFENVCTRRRPHAGHI